MCVYMSLCVCLEREPPGSSAVSGIMRVCEADLYVAGRYDGRGISMVD